MAKKQIETILFFDNGNVAVFDKQEKNIPSLNVSWAKIFVKFLIDQGYTKKQIEKVSFAFPGAKAAKYSAKYNNFEFIGRLNQ